MLQIFDNDPHLGSSVFLSNNLHTVYLYSQGRQQLEQQQQQQHPIEERWKKGANIELFENGKSIHELAAAIDKISIIIHCLLSMPIEYETI